VDAERQRQDGFLLPVGIVTLLLADIEGSSGLWETRPEAMSGAIGRHDAIVDEPIRRFGGVRPLEQGEGDSFVAAFSRSSDALRCALDLQLAFARESWPPGVRLRLRIALHTGEVQLRDDANYVGQAVNRCARLRDIAHGGQTLLSQSTYELVADRLPDDVTLSDLGTHRLKDLARPEHVYQLCHPELSAEFLPLRSLNVLPNNLPSQPTSFIGRSIEIAEIRKLLADNRLVTLTGSGGCGKTRLALQVAADELGDFPDGVWWVDLAPITDGAAVMSSLAAVLGVRDVPFHAVSTAVVKELKTKRLLLLMDNCEHLVPACAELADALLRECPGVDVLATSREPFGIAGEVPWRVPSMSVPGPSERAPIDALETFEAVRLFIDRATKSRPNFKVTNENAPAIVEICQRLDGIPLAVELASARVRTMTPAKIVDALHDRFRLLTGGSRTALPRQQTLLASVNWSYELLDDDQRLLLRRLSVFAGGFSLDAAEAICAGGIIDAEQILDVLSHLVDRSLVQMEDQDADGRYRLLETIRQYAVRELAGSGEERSIREKHLSFYLEFAEKESGAGESAPDLPQHAQAIEREYDNLRAAMDWSIQAPSVDEALRLTYALWRFWFLRYSLNEGVTRLKAALALDDGDARLRAQALAAAGSLSTFLFDFFEGRRMAEEALGVARRLDDATILAPTLHVLGWLETLALNDTAARPLIEECLRVTRATGQEFWRAAAAMALGVLETLATGNLPAAASALEESYSLALSHQIRIFHVAASNWLAAVRMFAGDLDAARSSALESLGVSDTLGERSFQVHNRVVLGIVATMRGEYEEAERLARDALALARDLGTPAELGMAAWGAGLTRYAVGDGDGALAILEEAASYGRLMGMKPFLLTVRVLAARIAALRNEHAAAAEFLSDASQTAPGSSNRYMHGLAHAVEAAIARSEGDLDRAEDLAEAAVVECGEAGARPFLAVALETLGGITVSLESYERAARLFGAADALRAALGFVRFPIDAPAHDEDVAAARARLGDEGFALEFEAGRRLSVEQAVAYAAKGRGPRDRPSSGWEGLTPTEIEVARLVAEGLTNRQIGERLFVAAGTVKTHLASIFTKMGISTRSELAAAVTRRGL
jgi:predicted ATPase/class 3 adenylate cyclase/DNA-binding CsgD family transcriptional regulator